MALQGTVSATSYTDQPTITVFTFFLDNVAYGVPLKDVLAVTRRDGDIVRVPDLPGAFEGVIQYQSTPTPVMDFAKMVGVRSGIETKQELVQLLEDRERDHILWLDALEKSLREDVDFEKGRDPNQCAFGRWFNKFSTRDLELRSIVDDFDEPHQRIHALAGDLLHLAEIGKKDEALNASMKSGVRLLGK